MLRKPLLDLCSAELDKRQLVLEEDKEYLLPFYIGGICSVYEAWRPSSQPASSLDEAGCAIATLVAHGFKEVVTPTRNAPSPPKEPHGI